MSRVTTLGCFLLMPILLVAQQWSGSVDVNGIINRNGNITANGLGFGRYNNSLYNDPNPYNIYTSDSEEHDLTLYGSGSLATLHLRLHDGNLKLGYNTTPNTILYNNGNATFNGNVGIGVTTAAEKLHLNGSIRGNINGAVRISSGNGYVDIGPQNGTWSHFQTDRAKFYFNRPIDVDGAISSYNANNLVLQTGGTTRLTVNSSTGNVGIGTTNPDYKLTVNGNIHAKEVKVDLSVPGPDYVFEPDYQLTSLEELKKYIAQHKHLPEIPSAKEMEANGINLMEMNVLLLKKLEELTLHIIKQEERIKKLENGQNK